MYSLSFTLPRTAPPHGSLLLIFPIFSVVVDFKIQIWKVLFQNPDLQKMCTGSVWMGVAWIGGVWIAGAWMGYV
ncbi:hypothetical protein IGI04_000428 [Brassica rapa subsp. trilocularis]|uniref:Uncharacterized protein n=1 Tax=Brassica rapa subsp. trilocularis TaxID=1813537 RepID=A0ABQ7NPR0_BRACM|nr:hypothetical protein IGI04_034899 [Brassica rapa subsp. trilocularis]KAG5390624.1 hypothetical protein IGI04_032165 [Brassica rapa subsp. trilocularis]KAG5412861.1 hypothetical protein IGI04_000428 [Brassica rapa subsp. trilocularis]